MDLGVFGSVVFGSEETSTARRGRASRNVGHEAAQDDGTGGPSGPAGQRHPAGGEWHFSACGEGGAGVAPTLYIDPTQVNRS